MDTQKLASEQMVYDPRGKLEVEKKTTAERVGSLGGLRLGVLDNTKWNAGKLLRNTVTVLGQEVDFGEVHFYKKESFSKDAAPELISRIASENDIALVAIGD
jgi:hypothetical protein